MISMKQEGKVSVHGPSGESHYIAGGGVLL